MPNSPSSISRLLRWYQENGRHSLPWRQDRTPYRVWVSEIMLQQTQVKTVLDYYSRFLSAFPDVTALAEAEEETVLRHWEGLGYYRRARQMHSAAKLIAQRPDASFPETFPEILALPGIGRYTAGAILSFALEQRFPILEANTQRLFARLKAVEMPTSSTAGQKILWQIAEDFIRPETSSESPCALNTALMDLGSLVCTPQEPQCGVCPFAQSCEALRLDRVSDFPLANPKTNYEARNEAAVLLLRPGKNRSEKEVLLLRYVPGEWWAGLWDFPRVQISEIADSKSLNLNSSNTETSSSKSLNLNSSNTETSSSKSLNLNSSNTETSSSKPLNLNFSNTEMEIQKFLLKTAGLRIRLKEELASFRHAVTRYRIFLRVFLAELAEGEQCASPRTPAGGEIRWVPVSELDSIPFCSTGRKISGLSVLHADHRQAK